MKVNGALYHVCRLSLLFVHHYAVTLEEVFEEKVDLVIVCLVVFVFDTVTR